LLTGVAVEKLTLQKMTEKTLRQDALQTAFSIPVDIFYPQNFSCFENNGLFEQPQAIILIEIYGHRESILAAKNLMVLSASIILTLGVVHLVYTFWGPKLMPRDPALQISMSQISPVITKETTMWRAWVGFNASHSVGLILSAWFSVFSHWLTANSSSSHRSCSLSGWQCLLVLLCSASFIFSVCLSQASAFLWPAMSPALRYRGPNSEPA
jgi:hypothetical protein